MTHFYTETITVEHDATPQFSKKPHCPDRFKWRGEIWEIVDIKREWRKSSHLSRTKQYVGLARIYFRVTVANGRQFDIYFDPKGKEGVWIMSKEV